jgi:WD40 repeat protein
MIVVVATVGWAMRRGIGRKTIFLVAFVTLPIRKCLFTLADSPLGVVAIQLLDGCTGVMAVTPYGLRAVSASWDHTLRLWDLDSGNEIATFTGESHMHSCAIAPDGQTIIAGDVSGRVHFLRLVEVDETKPVIGDTKIQLLLRKEQDARSATES